MPGHKRDGALQGIESDTDTGMTLQAKVKVHISWRLKLTNFLKADIFSCS